MPGAVTARLDAGCLIGVPATVLAVVERYGRLA
jgi:hypothetical protein